MAGRATKAGQTKARRLREQHGLGLGGPVPDLLALVEDGVGVPVAIFAALGHDLAGAYVRRGERRLILLNGDDHPVRLRFTLAHELAHHLFHDDARPDTHAGLATAGHWIEVRANAFASQLLMPDEAIDALSPADGLAAVLACAQHFGVSAPAAAFRLADRGRLDEAGLAAVRAQIDAGAHLVRLEAAEPFADSLAAALSDLPRVPPALRGTARPPRPTDPAR